MYGNIERVFRPESSKDGGFARHICSVAIYEFSPALTLWDGARTIGPSKSVPCLAITAVEIEQNFVSQPSTNTLASAMQL